MQGFSDQNTYHGEIAHVALLSNVRVLEILRHCRTIDHKYSLLANYLGLFSNCLRLDVLIRSQYCPYEKYSAMRGYHALPSTGHCCRRDQAVCVCACVCMCVVLSRWCKSLKIFFLVRGHSCLIGYTGCIIKWARYLPHNEKSVRKQGRGACLQHHLFFLFSQHLWWDVVRACMCVHACVCVCVCVCVCACLLVCMCVRK